jgi:hypothetical protein
MTISTANNNITQTLDSSLDNHPELKSLAEYASEILAVKCRSVTPASVRWRTLQKNDQRSVGDTEQNTIVCEIQDEKLSIAAIDRLTKKDLQGDYATFVVLSMWNDMQSLQAAKWHELAFPRNSDQDEVLE